MKIVLAVPIEKPRKKLEKSFFHLLNYLLLCEIIVVNGHNGGCETVVEPRQFSENKSKEKGPKTFFKSEKTETVNW